MSDEIKNIWAICPLCNQALKDRNGFSCWGGFSNAKCKLDHYEYQGRGSYASEAWIRIDGKEEYFYFDDGPDDSKKFYARVKEIRATRKFDEDLKALREASKPKSKPAEDREAKLREEFEDYAKENVGKIYHDKMAAFMEWAIKKLAERYENQEPPTNSVEEALKKCDEWRLTDEEVEELLK